PRKRRPRGVPSDSAGRHGQHRGCPVGRPRYRSGPGVHLVVPGQPVPGHHHLRRFAPRPPPPAPGPPGHASRGTRLAAMKLPVGILFLALVTLVVSVTQSIFNVFIFDSVLLAALGAIALNVLMGTGGQTSIGNSAFLAVGAFTAAWAAQAGLPA